LFLAVVGPIIARLVKDKKEPEPEIAGKEND
jgi:hypothetical protein